MKGRLVPAPGRGASALVRGLPVYPFADLERRADDLRRAGRDPIAFHIGDPDLPPDPAILAAAEEAALSPAELRYSTSRGEPELRQAIARWMRVRFGVEVDAEREVVVLLGSKEGLVALPRALVDPRDRVAVPDPGYPAYGAAALLAGARAVPLPLDARDRWRPVWDALPDPVRLVYLNYPNNPTGAVLDRAGLAEAVDRAADGGWTLAYDNAYSEVTHGAARAPSLLEIPAGREVGLEFHSLSKTFGVPGWRVGFAVGNADAVAALVKLKAQSDSGASRPLQRAAVAALGTYVDRKRPPAVDGAVREYGRRLERLAAGLSALGAPVPTPPGGLYLWQRARSGTGADLAGRLLERAGVLVTPGAAFGPGGEAYVRWAVTQPESEIERALDRLGAAPGIFG